MNQFDDFSTDPESNRPAFVKQELARLKTTQPDPAEIERRKRRAAEQLAKEDRLFGIWPGAFLGVPYSAGDAPEARDD